MGWSVCGRREGWEERLAKGSGVGGCSGSGKGNPGPRPFLSWAYSSHTSSGVSSGKLYLLLVMAEHTLTHVPMILKPQNTRSCDHRDSGTLGV